MKIMMTGSREFDDEQKIRNSFGKFMVWQGIDHMEVIMGGAKGADTLAYEIAIHHPLLLTPIVVPADWEKFGKRAGIIRNIEMLDMEPEFVLAFFKIGAGNRGTTHASSEASRRRIPVIEYWS